MLMKQLTVAAVACGFVVSGIALGADGATIKGVAKWDSKPRKQKPLQVAADPVCAKLHADEPLLEETFVVNDNSTLKHVFVYVKSGLPEGRKFDAPAEPVVLDQKGCHYVPHVFGVMVNQDLVIRNSDPTMHNINSGPKNNSGFNKGQPKQGMEFTEKFATPEMEVPFKCDVHPWMSATAHVMEHPFFATTNEKGEFEIKGLPAGTYVLATWLEEKRVSPQETTVTVSDEEATSGAVKEVEFVFTKP